MNDIAQCQHFASPEGAISQIDGPGALLSCIYNICEAEGGKEHLTQHVNADSMLTLLELLLSWMELPSFVQKPMLGTDILDSCPAVVMLIILLYRVVDSRFSGLCRNVAGETSCWPGCLSTICISCRKCRFCFSTPGKCHATVMLAMQQLMNGCIVAGTLASKTFAHCAMYHLLIYIR